MVVIVWDFLEYDWRIGFLMWKLCECRWFKIEWDWCVWNIFYVGKFVFLLIDYKGYLRGIVFKWKYFVY